MARRKPSKPPIDPKKPRAECFLLCDFAKAENGKLYIVGGGWNDIVPQKLPLAYSAYLAAKLTLPWELLSHGANVRIELVDREGRALGDPVSEVRLQGEKAVQSLGEPVSGAGSGSESTSKDQPIVADFLLANGVQMEIGRPGRYFLRLQVNDETLAATSFVVTSPGREADRPEVELEIIESWNTSLPPRQSQEPD